MTTNVSDDDDDHDGTGVMMIDAHDRATTRMRHHCGESRTDDDGNLDFTTGALRE